MKAVILDVISSYFIYEDKVYIFKRGHYISL